MPPRLLPLRARFTIKWDRNSRCFVCNSRKLRGVHSVIRDVFCPDYLFKKAVLGPNRKPKRGKQSRVSHTAATGRKHGTFVDKEIGKWCNAAVKAHAPNSTPAQRGGLTRVLNKLSNSAKKIVAYIHSRGWVPVSSQTKVGNPSLRTGTAVDLLCHDPKTGKYVVLEIKCGFETYYLKHTRKNMRAPFGNRNDSVYNQHQLQLGITVALFRDTYPSAQVGESCVLVARCHGVDVVPLKKWVMSKITQIGQRLALTSSKTQKQLATERRVRGT